MKYIIMCGGVYTNWETPRQLLRIKDETIVERTIRLLRETGIEDIAISSNDERFAGFGVPMLKHKNEYVSAGYNNSSGTWCNAFYLTEEPACYLFGDVIFSPEAVKIIAEYKTDDIMLFGSAHPLADEYPKTYIEPFAFKVQDTEHLKQAIKRVKELEAAGRFKREPIAWELWSVIRGTKINKINRNYIAINDYTCDIDEPGEIEKVMRFLE